MKPTGGLKQVNEVASFCRRKKVRALLAQKAVNGTIAPVQEDKCRAWTDTCGCLFPDRGVIDETLRSMRPCDSSENILLDLWGGNGAQLEAIATEMFS
jgi:hypothetical protein